MRRILPESASRSPFFNAADFAIGKALEAVDPDRAVHRHVKLDGDILDIGGFRYDLRAIERISIAAAGKAALPMAEALLTLLSDRITDGIALVHEGGGGAGRGCLPIRVIEAGHPIPTEAGAMGAGEMLRAATELWEKDLLLVALSGGASSLMTLPASGLALTELRATTAALLSSGADIREMNAVRKHLSAISGGRLAKAAFPSLVSCLVLSDVEGDDLTAIGSGPTAPDPTTFADALEVLDRFDLRRRVPSAVIDRLTGGIAGRFEETPKQGDPVFDTVRHVVTGSNGHALAAAKDALMGFGIDVDVARERLEGEARDMGRRAAAYAADMLTGRQSGASPRCLIFGGETTVTVTGRGMGGRNQELALAAAIHIAGQSEVMIVAFATDGRDGPTPAAGAVVTGETARRAKELGMDAACFLGDNDSHRFFELLGDLIVTGPTHTNVADLLLIFTR